MTVSHLDENVLPVWQCLTWIKCLTWMTVSHLDKNVSPGWQCLTWIKCLTWMTVSYLYDSVSPGQECLTCMTTSPEWLPASPVWQCLTWMKCLTWMRVFLQWTPRWVPALVAGVSHSSLLTVAVWTVPRGRLLAVCVPRTDVQRTAAVDCEDSQGRHNHSDQTPSAADVYATTIWPQTKQDILCITRQ